MKKIKFQNKMKTDPNMKLLRSTERTNAPIVYTLYATYATYAIYAVYATDTYRAQHVRLGDSDSDS